MKKIQKVRYIIAIYTIVATLAIIFWLLAFLFAENIYQATLINLATELLGVVFIFFIVNYLFSLDDLDTSERIDKLLDTLETEKTVRANDFFIKEPVMKDLIKEAKAVDLLGVALATTIDTHLSTIKEALKQGTDIRILIIEQRDDILQIAANRSETDDRPYYEKKLDTTVHNLEYLHTFTRETSEEFKGSLKIGFLSYLPSFSIKSFHKEDGDDICIVELFVHHIGWGEPPFFVLNRAADSEWYAYFQNQFEAMWQNSKKHEVAKNSGPKS